MKRFILAVFLFTNTLSWALTFPKDSLQLLGAGGENHKLSLLEDDKDGDDAKDKHYLAAVGGAVVANGTIFLWNKFMIRAGWTKVSYSDIEEFWTKRQSWDNDWYWTNFVLHPYQGALSYMAGRASGLNKVESLALATVASFGWEYLCETNEPSKNDLIYTPIGSLPVGEMLYRLSLEADSFSHILAVALNPMRLYTDIAAGEPPGTRGNIDSLSVKFNMGAMYTYSYFDHNNRQKGMREVFPLVVTPEISVVYGFPYAHATADPFSHFELLVGGGTGFDATKGEAMYDIHIFSNGLLFTFSPVFASNKDTTLGLGYDYDFYWHSFMEFSSIAPGFVIKQRIIKERAIYEWQFHLGYNILGTSDYFYYFHDYDRAEGLSRDYSFNTGVESMLSWKRTGSVIFDALVRYYGMYDFYNQKQTTAQTGWEDIILAAATFEVPATEHVSLGLTCNTYLKRAQYHDGRKVYQGAWTPLIFVRLQ